MHQHRELVWPGYRLGATFRCSFSFHSIVPRTHDARDYRTFPILGLTATKWGSFRFPDFLEEACAEERREKEI